MNHKIFSVMFSLIIGCILIVLFSLFLYKNTSIFDDFFDLNTDMNLSMFNKCYSDVLKNDRLNNYIASDEDSRDFNYIYFNSMPKEFTFDVEPSDLDKMKEYCLYVYDYIFKKDNSVSDFDLFYFNSKTEMGDIKVGDNYYNCDSPGGGLSQSQGNALDTNLKQFIINKKIIIYDSFSDSDKFDGYFIYKNIN